MNYYLSVLKNYAKFDGRARRAEYWYFVLFNFIAGLIAGFLDRTLNLDTNLGGNGTIYTIYALGTLLPNIAVAIRRMHDVGKSGWYCLIPIYNLILAVTEGDKGDNEYGPDPKGNTSGSTNETID